MSNTMCKLIREKMYYCFIYRRAFFLSFFFFKFNTLSINFTISKLSFHSIFGFKYELLSLFNIWKNTIIPVTIRWQCWLYLFAWLYYGKFKINIKLHGTNVITFLPLHFFLRSNYTHLYSILIPLGSSIYISRRRYSIFVNVFRSLNPRAHSTKKQEGEVWKERIGNCRSIGVGKQEAFSKHLIRIINSHRIRRMQRDPITRKTLNTYFRNVLFHFSFFFSFILSSFISVYSSAQSAITLPGIYFSLLLSTAAVSLDDFARRSNIFRL